MGSFLIFQSNAGVVLGYIVFAYIDYETAPYIGLAFSILFTISMCFTPETYHYLVSKGRMEAAEASLKYFRGPEAQLKDLLKKQEASKADLGETDVLGKLSNWVSDE